VRGFLLVLLALGVFGSGCGRPSGEAVTLKSCLNDLSQVASFGGDPVGSAGMVSTYDRTGGNNDGSIWSLIRPGDRDDADYEVVSLTGPGCLTRIWQTSLPAERWSFYFDGEPEPRIDVDGKTLFGGGGLFSRPLCGVASEGHYCYLPIPFEKSIRVVIHAPRLTPSARSYLQVNHVCYPRGTRVESFPSAIESETREAFSRVQQAWSTQENRGSSGATGCFSGEVRSRDSVEWLHADGAGVLSSFKLKISAQGGTTYTARERLLRDIVMQFTWNDVDKPSVDVPLGDFFCNAFNRRTFHSLPLSFTNNMYVCRFPMGFADGARGVLRNDGPTAVEVEATWEIEPEQASVNYFHARWSASSSGGRPHTVVSTQGAGHYVGCYLLAHGTDGSWFMLEGDEVIRADGKSGAVWHGTGLEDYFNGAWYYSGLFTLPLHGLVEKAAMRTAQYRFHMLDAVRFDKSLDVSFEFGDQNRSKGYMSSVGYWYAAAPVSAGSWIPSIRERSLLPDRIGQAAFMSQLFELERIGHYDEARDRCLAFVEQHKKGGTATDALRLRAAAYEERISGLDSVLATYRLVALQKNDISSQAKALLWYHKGDDRALFGAHANGKFLAFIDGQDAVAGSEPSQFYVKGLSLNPGIHLITAEVAPARSDTWFSATLRMHGADITTADGWEYATRRPKGWPACDGDGGVRWLEVTSTLRMLPRIGTWVFVPNAFVGMQSGEQLLSRLWENAGQNRRPGIVYLRRRFEILERSAGGE